MQVGLVPNNIPLSPFLQQALVDHTSACTETSVSVTQRTATTLAKQRLPVFAVGQSLSTTPVFFFVIVVARIRRVAGAILGEGMSTS